jgi:hypothetical protein
MTAAAHAKRQRGLFAEWQPIYAEHGIATFPVVIDGGGGKRPAVKGYLKVGSILSRELAIRFPDNDAFGFALGRSNRITVLDVDTSDERVLSDALAKHGASPLIVRSGSGNWQAWYRHGGESRHVRRFAVASPLLLLLPAVAARSSLSSKWLRAACFHLLPHHDATLRSPIRARPARRRHVAACV